MSDWQPDLYLKFKNERTQPSIDLVSKINCNSPKSIIDIGCGPGNSTQVLVNRWPKSKIVGIDSSISMIQKAKQEYPNQQWLVADASTYESENKFDILFSNAVIQWIPNHAELLRNFHSLLSNKGLIAIQIPLFWDMPLGNIIDAIANESRWRSQTNGVSNLFTIHNYSFYYDILSSLFVSIEIWETHYIHIIDSHESMLQMMKSTGLKPYLERLNEFEIIEFEEAVLEGIKNTYTAQRNGKVLLPFKRLFFIGMKI